MEYLSKNFAEDIAELQEIKLEDLISYELPFNLAEMFQ